LKVTGNQAVFPAAHGTSQERRLHEAERGGRAAYSQLLMFLTIAVVEIP
jgi:hypothetical protein